MRLFGGHAAPNEREQRGYQILRAGLIPVPATETFRDVSWHAPYSTLGVRVTGANGAVIRPGRKALRTIPWDCTIQWVDVIGAPSGSIVWNIYRATIAEMPIDNADTLIPLSIGLPKLVNQQASRDAALFGWHTTLLKDDVLAFDVVSASVLSTCTIALVVSRNNQP